jgi:hypothetical protein
MDKTSKICPTCGDSKSINEFYANSSKCKVCLKEYVKNRYYANVEALKEKARVKYRASNPRNWSEYDNKSPYQRKKAERERYQAKYPEKMLASKACNQIKNPNGHIHHWSYREEHYRDVIPLTVKQHNTAHRYLIYDQERMMYRNLEGVLLDTRERHEAYIWKMIDNEPT